MALKIYKHYFDKNDTPFRADIQAKKKYHTAWKRLPYKRFLAHNVVKIKLFGIFTIYDRRKDQNNESTERT